MDYFYYTFLIIFFRSCSASGPHSHSLNGKEQLFVFYRRKWVSQFWKTILLTKLSVSLKRSSCTKHFSLYLFTWQCEHYYRLLLYFLKVILWSDFISIGIVSLCGKNPFKANILSQDLRRATRGINCLSLVFIYSNVCFGSRLFFGTNVPCDGFKVCEDCTDFNISTPLGSRLRETLMNVFDCVSDYAGWMIPFRALSCHWMSNWAADWFSRGCRCVSNYCMGVRRILFVYQVVLGVKP